MLDRNKIATFANGYSVMALPDAEAENIDLTSATRLPFDQIPAIGAGISALVQAFNPAASKLDGLGNVAVVTDADGRPLDLGRLFQAKDGSGAVGGYFKEGNQLAQARFHEIDPDMLTTFDPTMVFVAAALSQITAKLDAIQKTQEEMLAYMKEKDAAELRASSFASRFRPSSLRRCVPATG